MMKDESLGAPGIWASTEVRGMVDEAVLEARVGSERSGMGTGVFLVMVGLEVAEKRGRHWVRVPQMCRVRVTDVVDQAEMLVASPGLAEAEQVRELIATEADSMAEVGGAVVDQVLESEVIVEVKAGGAVGTRIQWEHATMELLGILGIGDWRGREDGLVAVVLGLGP